ncbi:MAG: hypothetical protein IBX52_01325 [Bacterioplanes sp.]|nr:hypothetical protein [Bacterioplanes sp.]
MFRFLQYAKPIDEIDFDKIKPKSKFLVNVPIDQTISNLTCFTPQTNVFAQALKSYGKLGEEALRQQIETYYTTQICENVADIWSLNTEKLKGIHAMGVVLPWSDECSRENFARIAISNGAGRFLSREAAELGLNPTDSYGWQFFGPASRSLIDLECNRLVSVYDSIKNKGYKPAIYGHIHGYILTDGCRRKVVVVGGKHRYAALIALGYSRIKVLIKSKITPSVVSNQRIEQWPQYQNGTYSREDVLSIFERQLNGVGNGDLSSL